MRDWDHWSPHREFGEDRGAHHEITYLNEMCERDIGSPNNDYDGTYDDNYPPAMYEVGEDIRLLWPAKNHANYECSRWQLDHELKLFVNPNVNPTSDLGRDTSEWTLIKDYFEGIERTQTGTDGDQSVRSNLGIDGVAFQNCPHFCDNKDLAVCYGDFTVPDIFAEDGWYTFLWYWEFKSNEIYSVCWEAYVSGTNGNNNENTPSPTGRPTTRPTDKPSDKPTQKPTNIPTQRPSDDDINSGATAIYLQCGSSTSYTDSFGNIWIPDENYQNSPNTYTTGDTILGTEEDKLFQSERYITRQNTLTYKFEDIINTNYEVTLYFAEIYFKASGKRVFDVTIQDEQVETNLDIYDNVGHDTAYVKNYGSFAVTDGTLTITMTPSVENAKVNAIAIVPVN
jgi:hypothetical protein